VNKPTEDHIPQVLKREGKASVCACLALLLIALYLTTGPKIRLSQWQVTPAGNVALEEALAWKQGRLSLSRDYYEDAEVDGKHYNAVGLAFVIMSVIGTSLTEWAGGAPGTFAPLLYVSMVALPLPFVAFWAFRSVVRSSAWAAVFSFYLIAGTSLLPALILCGGGTIYRLNHVLAVVGLLVFSTDLLGRRRVWPAILGLTLAVWSRQMTCLYALPLLWFVWRDIGQSGTPADEQSSPAPSSAGKWPRRRLILTILTLVFIAAVPMTLNTLKFGSPFESGYRLLYAGRIDTIAQQAHRHFFGPGNIRMHAIAMNLAFPSWDVRGGSLYAVTSEINGGSIWLTSPLLLGVFVTARSWWRDRCRRVLMLSTIPVIAGLMCYHTTGALHAGYYRYSLDFIPIWLLVIAPHTGGRRGMLWTLACLAYSTLYFNVLSV
jgi:hypothetical protein